MKDRNDYPRCHNPRSLREYECKNCGWHWATFTFDFVERRKYILCAPCTRDQWQLELATGEKAGLN